MSTAEACEVAVSRPQEVGTGESYNDVVSGPNGTIQETEPGKACAVCSQLLPEQTGPGRPRKVCRDEDSPTPGGCARWRAIEKRLHRRGRIGARIPFTDSDITTLAAFRAAGHSFVIE